MVNSKVVHTIVVDVLGVNTADVTDESKLDDFPTWDSLACLSLLIGLEAEFEVEIDAPALFAVETVADIASVVKMSLGSSQVA